MNDKVATLSGSDHLHLEYSCTPTPTQLGVHAWTMDLYMPSDFLTADQSKGLIEWDIPGLDQTEHIGIWTEKGELTDYDGLMSLPNRAVELLRNAGIKVGEEYVN
jgi:hypothetical protein